MKRYVVGLLVAAGMAGAALDENRADADGEHLQGEWALASIEVQGKTLPAAAGKGGSIVFAKNGKLILKDPGKPDKLGKFTIDAGKSPKQLDLIEPKHSEAIHCIYEIDGDKLKLGSPIKGPKGKRPTGFEDKEAVIMHWKRQKS